MLCTTKPVFTEKSLHSAANLVFATNAPAGRIRQLETKGTLGILKKEKSPIKISLIALKSGQQDGSKTKSRTKQYIEVEGYEGKFEVTGFSGKYWKNGTLKKVWARKPGENVQYCFPINKTNYLTKYVDI